MDQSAIGFVGAGAVAARHVESLLTFDDVRVVAVADPVPGRAATLAARAGATAYRHHEDMLERHELDALYVCVPPFAHGAPEHAALDAGLPFFVEKPLAADLETAEAVAARVRADAATTAVGYHWRSLDTVTHAAELLRRNPARLVLGYWLDKVPPPAWWVRRDLSGGQTIEQTTHVLDLLRVLVGDPAEVEAHCSRSVRPAFPDADVADVTTALMRFADGTMATFASTCLLPRKHRAGLELFADGMTVEISELTLAVDVGEGREERRPSADAKRLVDRDFIDAVQGRADRVRAPYREALRTHRLACALQRSADEGRPVRPADEPARA